jgi:hypothetical protein
MPFYADPFSFPARNFRVPDDSNTPVGFRLLAVPMDK